MPQDDTYKAPNTAVAEEHLDTTGASKVTLELCRMLIVRDKIGQAKYQQTMDREDLKPSEWDVHHLEELLDAAAYTLRGYQKRKRLEMCVAALLRAWDDAKQQGYEKTAYNEHDLILVCRVDELRKEWEQA